MIPPVSPGEGELVHMACVLLTRAEAALQRRKRRFNPLHAGARANPATGMDAAPTSSPTTPEMAASAIGRALGRSIVRGMPMLLKILSVVGTSAMIWVGGGIILHGLEVYGPPAIGSVVKAAEEAAAHAFPPAAGALEWIVAAAISGVVGLLVGAASIPIAGFALAPAWAGLKRLVRR